MRLSGFRIWPRSRDFPDNFLFRFSSNSAHRDLWKACGGASGGFRLAQHPTKISLAEIVDAVDDAARVPRPIFPTAGSTKEMDVIAGLWRDLHQKQRKILEGTTLADLMSRVSKPDDLMYVI